MDNLSPKFTKKEKQELWKQNQEVDRQRRARLKTIKRIALWAFLAVFISAAGFGLGKLSLSDSSSLSRESLLQRAEADWIKGDNGTKNILIEYSDFQCPACVAYHPLLKQLHQEFGDKIVFIYRHFPLRQIHPRAELAARVAEAAGKQNQFWEMHDLIFENQPEWSDQKNAEEIFVQYAGQLNLDIEKFKNDLNSKKIQDKINRDYQGGTRLDVNATPTFFLNGNQLQNPRSYEEFKSLIQETIFQ